MYPQPPAVLAVGWDSVILKSLCMNWSQIKYETVKLGDICKNLDGKRRPLNNKERNKIRGTGKYPYFGANNIMDWVDEYIFDEKILCIAEDGGNWGNNQKCSFIYNGKCWVNNHAHVLSGKDNVILEFLMYYLNFADLDSYITGSTRGKLTKSSLDNLQIPLPSLEVQQQIATLLDRADTLRQLDRQLFTHYDTLIQSVFLEMFGDPVKNEKGWEVKKLGDILDFITSGSRGWAEYYSNSGSLFLRIQNVGYNRLKMNEIAFVNPPNTAEAKRTKVCEGDILLSITADLGRTAVIPKNFGEAYISQHLALLRPEREINSFFISELLASDFGQRQFKSANKGGVKAGLNFNDIKAINILLPPLTLQQRFAAIVEKIEAQKAMAAAQAEASEALFQGLLQKAFGKH